MAEGQLFSFKFSLITLIKVLRKMALYILHNKAFRRIVSSDRRDTCRNETISLRQHKSIYESSCAGVYRQLSKESQPYLQRHHEFLKIK